MAGMLKSILFFSNFKVPSDVLSEVNSAGFEVVYSKGKARLIDEILTLKPAALVVDGKYCSERGLKCDFLLQKVRHSIRETPVFLVNTTDVDYVKLMADNLIYAIMKDQPDFKRLLSSIQRYFEAGRARAELTRIRSSVSLPCLLKKLGTSGVLQGKICDLSPKGMKIIVERASDDWIAGDEVRFSFSRIGEKSAHLDGYGCVRWFEKVGGASDPQGVQLGLEFSQLPLPTLYEFLEILNSSRSA